MTSPSPSVAGMDAGREARGIIFSGDSVRAILSGTKTQTRRVVADSNTLGNYKPSECDMSKAWVDPGPSPAGNRGPYLKAPVTVAEDPDIIERLYPVYAPGDVLWVKETWCPVDDREHGGEQWIDYRATPRYSAEHPAGWDAAPEDAEALKWRSPVIMPRRCSRLTLEITEVRVERLTEISAFDCHCEGIRVMSGESHVHAPGLDGRDDAIYRDAFAREWNALTGKRAPWKDSPWVWVISFALLAIENERGKT